MAPPGTTRRSKIVLHLRPQDEAALLDARDRLSRRLDPIPLSELLEVVALEVQGNASLAHRMVRQVEAIREGRITGESYRPSSVDVDERILEWLVATVDPAPKRAVIFFLRWIASDWDYLAKKLVLGKKPVPWEPPA